MATKFKVKYSLGKIRSIFKESSGESLIAKLRDIGRELNNPYSKVKDELLASIVIIYVTVKNNVEYNLKQFEQLALRENSYLQRALRSATQSLRSLFNASGNNDAQELDDLLDAEWHEEQKYRTDTLNAFEKAIAIDEKFEMEVGEYAVLYQSFLASCAELRQIDGLEEITIDDYLIALTQVTANGIMTGINLAVIKPVDLALSKIQERLIEVVKQNPEKHLRNQEQLPKFTGLIQQIKAQTESLKNSLEEMEKTLMRIIPIKKDETTEQINDPTPPAHMGN